MVRRHRNYHYCRRPWKSNECIALLMSLVLSKTTLSFRCCCPYAAVVQRRFLGRPSPFMTTTTTTRTSRRRQHRSGISDAVKSSATVVMSSDTTTTTTLDNDSESSSYSNQQTISERSPPPQQLQPHHPQLSAMERGAAKEAARARRKKLLGVAKAVDRGLPNVVTYNPAQMNVNNGIATYQAKSGLPDMTKLFTVLGIESSCDDTGAAIVRSDGVILGEALAKQQDIHEVWGGVVPGLARDAHIAAMDTVVDTALQKAGMTSIADVDAIAVTVGPGLEICLRVGCEKALQLAQTYNKPFVGVHHLEAHILMARLPPQLLNNNNDNNENNSNTQTTTIAAGISQPPRSSHCSDNNNNGSQSQHCNVAIEFPFLALLVSGGHCQILQCMGIGQYHIMGGTLDDSLGEAYDKTARLLGLPVGGGGGPAVEQLAAKGDPKAIPLSIPMQSRKDCDFSYAGLKTNVRRAAEKLVVEYNTQQQQQQDDDNTTTATRIDSVDQLPEQYKANIAASFQHVAIRHVEDRLQRAMTIIEEEQSDEDDKTKKNNKKIQTLAVVGGVAANQVLRQRLEVLCANRKQPWTMIVPPPRLCTDQGAMSAWAGVERLMVGSSDELSNHVYARYPLVQQDR